MKREKENWTRVVITHETSQFNKKVKRLRRHLGYNLKIEMKSWGWKIWSLLLMDMNEGYITRHMVVLDVYLTNEDKPSIRLSRLEDDDDFVAFW